MQTANPALHELPIKGRIATWISVIFCQRRGSIALVCLACASCLIFLSAPTMGPMLQPQSIACQQCICGQGLNLTSPNETMESPDNVQVTVLPTPSPATKSSLAPAPATCTSTARYLTLNFGIVNGAGLANMMYVYAALIGISKYLNMIPYVNATDNHTVQNYFELSRNLFPNLAVQLPLRGEAAEKEIPFAQATCCTYKNVSLLLDSVENVSSAVVVTSFVQSYKYFHDYRSDVRRLFAFRREDLLMAAELRLKLGGSDHANFGCIHTRRTDFVTNAIYEASSKQSVDTAIETLRSFFVVVLRLPNYKVVLFGDDEEFLRETENYYTGHNFTDVAWAQSNSKMTDMAFMATHCRAMFITASASTFGFWASYLSEQATVFYNPKFASSGDNGFFKEFKPEDVFLPSWIPIPIPTTE